MQIIKPKEDHSWLHEYYLEIDDLVLFVELGHNNRIPACKFSLIKPTTELIVDQMPKPFTSGCEVVGIKNIKPVIQEIDKMTDVEFEKIVVETFLAIMHLATVGE
jgi:hypothetical protein